MIDSTLVFDGVLHIVDFSFDNLRPDAPQRDAKARQESFEVAERLTGGIFNPKMLEGDIPDYLSASPDAVFDLMFAQSPTDMAMVGNTPFAPPFSSINSFDDPEHLRNVSHKFVSAHPERCLFGGGTDPALGLNYALDSIDVQVRELGARSMKFYPMAWQCDDEKVAYPMFQKCHDLGVKVLQFHKSFPFYPSHDVEMQRPNDLQAPARDFPDMTFIMHHPVPLYFEETINIAQRFPNFYLLLAPLLHMLLVKPRAVQHMVGQLLQQVGVDKLVYGSEGPMGGNPSPYIEAIKSMEIPPDLRDGYGYPQITSEDKDKILGLNYARLFDIDVEAKKVELTALPKGR